MNKKYLIMGLATNIEENRIDIFCSSIRKIYPMSVCDIILITKSNDLPDYIKYKHDIIQFSPLRSQELRNNFSERLFKRTIAYNILIFNRFLSKQDTVHLNKINDILFEYWLHPHLSRWFSYKRVFENYSGYQKVMITDIRDVFVQDYFFDDNLQEGVHLTEEFGQYGSSPFNDRNYKKTYGKRRFNYIKGRSPLCMGVLISDFESAKNFCSVICKNIVMKPFIGSDQVRVNELVRRNGVDIPIHIHRNIDDVVSHLNIGMLSAGDIERIIEIREGQLIRRSDGRVIPVVHMYDRWEPAMIAANDVHVGNISDCVSSSD